MSESSCVDGESVIAVVYRESASNKPSDVPLDNLESKQFDFNASWEGLFSLFKSEMSTKDVLAVTHTARNIG
jgi:hypothetical protein